MAGYEERLIEQFAQWSARGSGMLPPREVPVTPEPAFQPFVGYTMRREGPVDDGRRHTVFSRLLEGSRPRKTPPPLPAEVLPEETPLEELIDLRSELVEHQLLPVPGEDSAMSDFEQLLYGLSGTKRPISFEILADHQTIVMQLCCDGRDATLLSQCVDTYLPGIGLSRHEKVLEDLMGLHAHRSLSSVQLALGDAFPYPLRPLKLFSHDPYQGILGTMSGLSRGETAIFQVNFEPCGFPWASSLWTLAAPGHGPTFSEATCKDLLEVVQEKTRKPLFAVQVRLSAFAEEPERASEILEMVGNAFAAYNGRNGFMPVEASGEDDATQKALVLLRASFRSGMILNADELCALVHLPGKDVHCPKLVCLTERTSPAPERKDAEGGLILGLNLHRGEDKVVRLTSDERTKHMHVIGASGTGKSTFLLNCILQDIRRGDGCALLDPHGDLVDQVLENLPEERVQDVVLFDPSDEEYPVGFNMLSAGSEVEKNLLASDFVSIFRRLSAAWGDQMTAILGNATLAILESPQGGTLLDLRRFLVERAFRNQFLKTVEDPEVRYFWEHEFALLKGNSIASLLTRLNAFIRQKLIRNMIAQDGRKLDFAKIMDDRKIFLAPLSQGLIGLENSWLLGSLLVSKFYQIALARQTQLESERQRFWLYLDEAHNFITESISSILSGTRKYGLGLILAHQELDQFGRQEAAILSSILTNSYTRVCFRVGDQDARKLQEGFEHFQAEDLRKLGLGAAICRIGGSDHDFNLTAAPPPDGTEVATSAQAARNYSREHYAIHRDEIEQAVTEQADSRAEALKREAATGRRGKKAVNHPADPVAKAPPPPTESPASSSPPVEPKSPQPVEEPGLDTGQAGAPPPDSNSPAKAEATKDGKAESAPPSRPAVMPAAAHFKKGWGGPEHKAIQDRIKQHANGLGFRATVEAALPERKGSIDVLLETQSRKIAIEVALRSPIDQEVRNIAKALESEISRIVVVSDSAAHLANIREAADSAGLELANNRVSFIHSDEIGEFLNSMRAAIPPSEMTTLGYTVKTKYNKLSEAELRARKDSVHRALDEATRRLRSEGNETENSDEGGEES